VNSAARDSSPGFDHRITGLFLAGIAVVTFCLYADGWSVISYRELRYEGVDEQDNSCSCGPAALATIFSVFFGVQVSENDFVNLILYRSDQDPEDRSTKEISENGVSMLDLKQASVTKGILARGYQIPKGNLGTILRELSLPLLIHLDAPDQHFAVAVTQVDERIVLADPSWGMIVISLIELYRYWNGLILAFAPNEEGTDRARVVIERIQGKVVESAKTLRLSKMFLWTLS